MAKGRVTHPDPAALAGKGPPVPHGAWRRRGQGALRAARRGGGGCAEWTAWGLLGGVPGTGPQSELQRELAGSPWGVLPTDKCCQLRLGILGLGTSFGGPLYGEVALCGPSHWGGSPTPGKLKKQPLPLLTRGPTGVPRAVPAQSSRLLPAAFSGGTWLPRGGQGLCASWEPSQAGLSLTFQQKLRPSCVHPRPGSQHTSKQGQSRPHVSCNPRGPPCGPGALPWEGASGVSGQVPADAQACLRNAVTKAA